MKKMHNFTYSQIDALTEISSIGAGCAATALSKLLEKKVMINVPKVIVVKLEEIESFIKNPEEKVFAVYFELMEGLEGSLIIIFPIINACLVVDIITKRKLGSTDNVMGFLEKSVLMEVGNIAIGSYLSALSSMVGFVVRQSIPYIAKDLMSGIFNSIVADISLKSEKIIMTQVKFIDEDKILKGDFYIIFDTRSSLKILNSLELKMKIIEVGMGSMVVTEAPNVILARSLGSCVGIALYDPGTNIGAMAHIMLPDSALAKMENYDPAKFADTAVPAMMEEMISRGAVRGSIVAKIVGGADMFTSTIGSKLNIGKRNVNASNDILKKCGIKILASDVGQDYARTVKFNIINGSINIKTGNIFKTI